VVSFYKLDYMTSGILPNVAVKTFSGKNTPRLHRRVDSTDKARGIHDSNMELWRVRFHIFYRVLI